MADLVAQVKAIQKQEGGADLWGSFVAQNGGGKRDPAMKEQYQLQAFIQQAASMGYSTQGGGGGKGGGGGGKKGGSWGGGGSFNGGGKGKGSYGKAPAMGNMMMGGGNMEGLQNNMTLVTRVKAAQKMEGGREAWIQFIDYKGGVNRDPARRTQDELEEFLATYDPNGESLAPALEMATAQMLPMMQMMMGMGGGGGGGMGAMMSMMGGMGGGKGGGKKGGKSQFSPESEEHAQLIQKVKHIQKEEMGKEAWKGFVAASGVGFNDPAAHSCESLASFISQQDPTFDPTTFALNADSNKWYIEQIRKGQKMSNEFKEAWIVYTDANGDGIRDPSRHDAAFIQPFLDSAPVYESFENDAEHTALLTKIKTGQRASQEFKESWWTFCQSYGDGKNDPAKHDKLFLQNFLDQSGGVPTAGGGGGGGGGAWGGGGGKSKGGDAWGGGGGKSKGKGARWTPY